MSRESRSLSRLVVFSAVAATVGLVGHFVVSPPPNSFSSIPSVEAFAAHQPALLAGAWLDGMGSILLIAALLGIVELARQGGTLASRIVLVGGAAVVAHSLLTDTLLIAAAQMTAGGAAASGAAAVQIAHAADYAFPMINVFWAAALGVVVLRSGVLARGFGYVAIAFAAIELVGGLAELYSDAVYSVINPFFLVMVIWSVVASIVLAVRTPVHEATAAPTHVGAARA